MAAAMDTLSGSKRGRPNSPSGAGAGKGSGDAAPIRRPSRLLDYDLGSCKTKIDSGYTMSSLPEVLKNMHQILTSFNLAIKGIVGQVNKNIEALDAQEYSADTMTRKLNDLAAHPAQ